MKLAVSPKTFLFVRNALAFILAIQVGYHRGHQIGSYYLLYLPFFLALDLIWVTLIATKKEFLLCFLAITLTFVRIIFEVVEGFQSRPDSQGLQTELESILLIWGFSLVISLFIALPIYLWRKFCRDRDAIKGSSPLGQPGIIDALKLFALIFCHWWFLHP